MPRCKSNPVQMAKVRDRRKSNPRHIVASIAIVIQDMARGRNIAGSQDASLKYRFLLMNVLAQKSKNCPDRQLGSSILFSTAEKNTNITLARNSQGPVRWS